MKAVFSSRRVPRIRLLAGGHLVIGLTILLGVAAVHTGLNLLHALVAVLLAFQAVSGFRSFRVLRSIEVEATFPGHVDADGSTTLELVVRNRKRRVASVSLEAAVAAEGRGALDVGPAWIARVEAGGETAARLPVHGRARGPARLVVLRVSTSYPCDLFRRTLSIPLDVPVLVRPRRRDVSVEDRGGDEDSPARRSARPVVGPGEFRRLRPYRDGDPPRAIHWKTSARRGAPYVREDETRRPSPWAVVLVPSAASPPEAVEEAVETAAALLRLARRSGRPAHLCVAGEVRPIAVRDGRSLSEALDALARFEPKDAGAPRPPRDAREFRIAGGTPRGVVVRARVRERAPVEVAT
jgi:uncharacterized protein (DUF58 family)